MIKILHFSDTIPGFYNLKKSTNRLSSHSVYYILDRRLQKPFQRLRMNYIGNKVKELTGSSVYCLHYLSQSEILRYKKDSAYGGKRY